MRNPLLALLLTVALTACDGGSNTSSGLPDCPDAPAPLTGETNLPPNFPIPDEVVVTQTRAAGPTTVVNGYADAGIPSLWEEWKAALDEPPYSVVKSEQEAHDAEVNFEGEETTGQVRLGEECKGRTSVQVTARPL